MIGNGVSGASGPRVRTRFGRLPTVLCPSIGCGSPKYATTPIRSGGAGEGYARASGRRPCRHPRIAKPYGMRWPGMEGIFSALRRELSGERVLLQARTTGRRSVSARVWLRTRHGPAERGPSSASGFPLCSSLPRRAQTAIWWFPVDRPAPLSAVWQGTAGGQSYLYSDADTHFPCATRLPDVQRTAANPHTDLPGTWGSPGGTAIVSVSDVPAGSFEVASKSRTTVGSCPHQTEGICAPGARSATTPTTVCSYEKIQIVLAELHPRASVAGNCRRDSVNSIAVCGWGEHALASVMNGICTREAAPERTPRLK